MNMITLLTDRIEEYRKENKNPCKNYATEQSAIKATEKVADLVGKQHGTHPAQYLVFYNEAWGRWVGVINLTETLTRTDSHGGYVGLAGSKGFFTF
jgi:hypothetical protein